MKWFLQMVNNVCGVCDGLKALERKMKTTTHYSNKYALTTVKRSFPDQESPLELTVPHQCVTQDFHCGFCTKSTAGNVGAQHTHVHIDTHTHTQRKQVHFCMTGCTTGTGEETPEMRPLTDSMYLRCAFYSFEVWEVAWSWRGRRGRALDGGARLAVCHSWQEQQK